MQGTQYHADAITAQTSTLLHFSGAHALGGDTAVWVPESASCDTAAEWLAENPSSGGVLQEVQGRRLTAATPVRHRFLLAPLGWLGRVFGVWAPLFIFLACSVIFAPP